MIRLTLWLKWSVQEGPVKRWKADSDGKEVKALEWKGETKGLKQMKSWKRGAPRNETCVCDWTTV